MDLLLYSSGLTWIYDCYLNILLHKLSKENKIVFLLDDFNKDSLRYNNHSSTYEFLDSIYSNMLLPHIIQPTRRNYSKTTIDNIYANAISSNSVSWNLTATISDHYPQFVIAPAIFSNSPSAKLNIFKRDWKTLFLTSNRCNFEKTF